MPKHDASVASTIFKIVRPLLVAYLIVVLLLMLFEEKLIFPAPRDTQPLLASVHDDFQDVVFPAEDGTQLHGRLYGVDDPCGYILYCHGNGDMISWLDGYARQLRDDLEVAVFAFDYRGYGRSHGSPHEQGVIQDAQAARQQFARLASVLEEEIVLMGRSLGGAVAVELAAEIEPPALILQNTFSRLPDVAAFHYPWVPVRLLLRSRFDAIAKAPLIKCPVFQSHGTDDAIIPYELGRRLFDNFAGKKQFFPAVDCGHNDPEPADYPERLKQFVMSL